MKLAGLVLAAGRGARFGGPIKQTALLNGRALVSHAARAALGARLAPVLVVLGHEAVEVRAALIRDLALAHDLAPRRDPDPDLDLDPGALTPSDAAPSDAAQTRAASARGLRFVDAPRYGDGIAESLKAGIAVMPDDVDGVFVLLSDMPFITPDLLEKLAAASRAAPGALAAAPTWAGQRGNPVLVMRRAFPLVGDLEGDKGLGQILTRRADEVILVAADDDACLRDIDTPGALDAARGA